MADANDDYVYDEQTGEWRPASELAAETVAGPAVVDASGNVLADGDSVVLIKDLKVKGAGQTLKQGTVIKSIRLTDNPEEIDCRHDPCVGIRAVPVGEAMMALVLADHMLRHRGQTGREGAVGFEAR